MIGFAERVLVLKEEKDSVLEKIKNNAENITEDDLDCLVDELTDHYSNKIASLSRYTYQTNGHGALLARRAFTEHARKELYKGIYTYLFTSEHWRSGRDINSYLLTVLNRLSDRIRLDIESNKKVSVPICPACKHFGNKEYLHQEDKLLRCRECTSSIDRIEDELLSITDLSYKAQQETRLSLHKIFSLHSRKGFRCPDCKRFMPHSYVHQYGVSCPYDDCVYFGSSSELESMAHPLGLGSRPVFSLNAKISHDSSKTDQKEIQEFIEDESVAADVKLEFSEKYENELNILNEVVLLQEKRLKDRYREEKVILKLLMYQAYKNMIDKNPEDMVSYLVHMKHGGAPIQSKIFQEYVKLIQNSLPLEIERSGKVHEIYSLLDPELMLFLGVSKFDARIGSNHIIPNNTLETYVGGRKYKNFGPCFIGLLENVIIKDTGESIINNIKNYTFVEIEVDDSIAVDTEVEVTHLRIPSHYEMLGLVHLQRVRRKIVDSVYLKLNGKKREVKCA